MILKRIREYVQMKITYLQAKGNITIADLGCADGKNDAINLIEIIKVIQEEAPFLEIIVFMNDLP